jgi:NAD(P)-dependent dehydrogenase (short-subunit alcohol dehydrogenase family)
VRLVVALTCCHMDLQLGGKVALVTGVSQGIGLAVAGTLLGEGMRVVGTSRTVPSTRSGLFHVELDMSETGAGESAVAATLSQFGQLDVLVNNVGGGPFRPGFADQTETDWSETLALSLMSAVRTTRSALAALIRSGGVVLNISSINGHLPATILYPYNAAKAAMNSLTVGLSQEFATQGVRVVGIAPGVVSTQLITGPGGLIAHLSEFSGREPQTILERLTSQVPIGRLITPQEVADLAAFLASPRAAAITGTTVNIDGGFTPTT